MSHRQRNLLTVFLVSCLSLVASAAPPSFTEQVAAIEAAESAELARLDQAVAEAGSQAEILELQRCVTYVKLASRLALHEAQLSLAPQDPAVTDVLADLVGEMRARVAAQEPLLPADYTFAPLAAIAQEVPACDE